MRSFLPILLCTAILGAAPGAAPDAAAQCVKGDCRDGTGTYDFGWGTYTGGFVGGQMHGPGVFDYGDVRYMGPFEAGKEHGPGLLIYPDGRMEEVEYARGRRVRKPTPVAVEVRTTPETGCVAGDCTNGTGTFVYAGGNRYEGQWRDGNREGRGTGFFADGDRYEGEWRNNVFHGRGTYTWTTGVRFTGTYADGEEVDGTYTSSWGTSARIAGGELVEPPPDPAAAAGAGTQEGGAAAREYYLVYAVVPNTTREIAWVDIPTSYAIHCYSVDAPADMDRQSLMDRIRRQIAFTRMPQYGRRRVREFHGFQIDDRGRSCYEVARTESMRVGREVVGWYDAPPTISIDW